VAETVTRVAGLLCALAYAAFGAWVYAQQPRTVAELRGAMAAEVGTYQIDRPSFEEGIRFFRAEKFEEARAAFALADPASRDATTQFYVAYTFYRQGWGRLYNDDALFKRGLAAVEHAITLAPGGRVEVRDGDLGLRTGDELRAELQRGLTRDASDFDPRRLMRERQ
jgi:hypothetical protein